MERKCLWTLELVRARRPQADLGIAADHPRQPRDQHAQEASGDGAAEEHDGQRRVEGGRWRRHEAEGRAGAERGGLL